MTEYPDRDWWRMGWDARMRGDRYDPPHLIRDDDPRTLAWIDGWETADQDQKAKGEA